MDIIISNASQQPIYEQIYLQIKNQIIAGMLAEGDALPSIRSLAKDLRISVITTKRAYDELEQEGFLSTGDCLLPWDEYESGWFRCEIRLERER